MGLEGGRSDGIFFGWNGAGPCARNWVDVYTPDDSLRPLGRIQDGRTGRVDAVSG